MNIPWLLLLLTLVGSSQVAPPTASFASAEQALGPATRGADAGSLGPDSTDRLIRAVRLVEEARPHLDSVWPGFWPDERAYLIHRDGTSVLVSHQQPPSDWRPVESDRLDGDLAGRVHRRSGPLSELASGFDMDFQVGQRTVAAVRWSRDIFGTLERLFHEQFHVFQRERFSATRGAEGLGVQEEPHLAPEVISDPSFRARAEVERRVLADAVAATGTERRKELLRSYLAVRSRRMEAASEEVRVAEINIERKEGSAQYVGLDAAARATGTPEAVPEELAERLAMALDTTSFGEGAYPEFRARLYGTGAGLAGLLADLAPGWRIELVDGATFPELAADAVAYDDGPRQKLADATEARYGYSELLTREQVRPATPGDQDPVRELLAAGEVTLVVELLPDSPRMVEGMSFNSDGGFPRQVESGLILNEAPGSFELSLGQVAISLWGAPVAVDVRSAPDTVRVAAALSAGPEIDGAVPPDGNTRWTEGFTMTSEELRLRVEGPTRTSVHPDSIHVRTKP